MRTRDEYIAEVVGSERLVRAKIWSFTRHHADTDELVQDTLARLLTVSSTVLRRVKCVRAFALTTALHIAIDWKRHREAVTIEYVEDIELSADCIPECSMEESFGRAQNIERLVKGLMCLTPRSRQVFVMKRVFGFSQKEIAEALGITTNTVEQHLMKAIRRIAGYFAGKDLVVKRKRRIERQTGTQSRKAA
ncbi:MAG TPA: RNA polymerase sigma factor [Steroidobacteraceae bacterium]|jgi:RNA polymerase sigma-70 factor (ECF subfamily)